MRRPGVEPATCWLQVQRPNHYTTEPHINWPVAQPSSRPRHKGVFEALKRPQCARLWLCLTATEEDLRAVGPVLQRQRTAAHGCSQRNRKCRRRVTWQGARSAGRHRRKHRLRADRDNGTDRVQNTRASVLSLWYALLADIIVSAAARQQPNFTLICRPAAGQTVHQDRLFQACFPVFSSVCVELAATNSSDQRLFVCI